MSNKVTMFDFDGSDVRVIEDAKGEPWFLAKDICDILGLTNPTMALSNLDEDERAKFNLGRQGDANIINESGMYSLVMTSRKPEAKKFKKWVTSEVLPSIRKTGRYGLVEMPDLNDPTLLQTLLLDNVNKVLALQSEVKEKNTVIEQQAPKVEAFEKLSGSEGSMNITSAAKSLNVQPKKMFDALSQLKWIFRRAGGSSWIAYQDKIQTGYLEHKVTTVSRSDGTDKITEQVRVTPKGLTKLASLALN